MKGGAAGAARRRVFLHENSGQVLTPKWGLAYKPHLSTSPASGRAGALLKLLTGTVKRYPTVLGCAGFDGPSVRRRVGIAAASARAFRLFEN